MELKGKKVLVFGAGKSGIGAADLLGAVGACPILYDLSLIHISEPTRRS